MSGLTHDCPWSTFSDSSVGAVRCVCSRIPLPVLLRHAGVGSSLCYKLCLVVASAPHTRRGGRDGHRSRLPPADDVPSPSLRSLLRLVVSRWPVIHPPMLFFLAGA